jgi:hypothetical protein
MTTPADTAEGTQRPNKEEKSGGRVPRLVGRLVFAGDLEINEEKISGCAVEIDRSDLSASKIPMYKTCMIITQDEYWEMRAEMDRATIALAAELKSWNTLTNENCDLRLENAMLRKGILPANAEVSHGDRERQPDTHSTHNQP